MRFHRSCRETGWQAALMGVLLLLQQASSGAQEPSPQPTLTVTQILDSMSATTAGLQSYSVPVHIEAHVKKGVLSVPVQMDGDRYFKAPDRVALKVRTGVPAVAKAFSNTYASLGTPLTWVKTFNIAYDSAGDVGAHHVYTLRATYKHPSKVDHILLDIDSTTFDPVQARWFYQNGATIAMQIQQGVVDGKYRLPQHETVNAKFPDYQGSAVVTYGSYATNVPVSDSMFTQ